MGINGREINVFCEKTRQGKRKQKKNDNPTTWELVWIQQSRMSKVKFQCLETETILRQWAVQKIN